MARKPEKKAKGPNLWDKFRDSFGGGQRWEKEYKALMDEGEGISDQEIWDKAKAMGHDIAKMTFQEALDLVSEAEVKKQILEDAGESAAAREMAGIIGEASENAAAAKESDADIDEMFGAKPEAAPVSIPQPVLRSEKKASGEAKEGALNEEQQRALDLFKLSEVNKAKGHVVMYPGTAILRELLPLIKDADPDTHAAMQAHLERDGKLAALAAQEAAQAKEVIQVANDKQAERDHVARLAAEKPAPQPAAQQADKPKAPLQLTHDTSVVNAPAKKEAAAPKPEVKQTAEFDPNNQPTAEQLRDMSQADIVKQAEVVTAHIAKKGPHMEAAKSALHALEEEWMTRGENPALLFTDQDIDAFIESGAFDVDPEELEWDKKIFEAKERERKAEKRWQTRAEMLASYDERALEGVNTSEPFTFGSRTMRPGEMYQVTDPNGDTMSFTVVGHHAEDNHLITTGNQPWELMPWTQNQFAEVQGLANVHGWKLDQITPGFDNLTEDELNAAVESFADVSEEEAEAATEVLKDNFDDLIKQADAALKMGDASLLRTTAANLNAYMNDDSRYATTREKILARKRMAKLEAALDDIEVDEAIDSAIDNAVAGDFKQKPVVKLRGTPISRQNRKRQKPLVYSDMEAEELVDNFDNEALAAEVDAAIDNAVTEEHVLDGIQDTEIDEAFENAASSDPVPGSGVAVSNNPEQDAAHQAMRDKIKGKAKEAAVRGRVAALREDGPPAVLSKEQADDLHQYLRMEDRKTVAEMEAAAKKAEAQAEAAKEQSAAEDAQANDDGVWTSAEPPEPPTPPAPAVALKKPPKRRKRRRKPPASGAKAA